MVETLKETATYLKSHNRSHFDQAQGTPFTMPPLSAEFDWALNSVTSEVVSEGDYSNSEIDFLQQKLLEHCKRNTMLQSLVKQSQQKNGKRKQGYGRSGLPYHFLASI
eukprot:576516-Ditylum_brightwellii.AAC.1